ncbi:MAG: damage-inducible protein, partial [Alphaproteobacteria bacterium]|nr:damage-inducible protein [Alphaproteobacteria bacterium]
HALMPSKNLHRRAAITDAALKIFCDHYGAAISKVDLFYYIYGILHSEEYRSKFAANLTKELPRIPFAQSENDFWRFSLTGRKLAEIHVDYEIIPPEPTVTITIKPNAPTAPKILYRVTRMEPDKKDRSRIAYNDYITVENIPLAAYDYIVNGKSAIAWVMDFQGVWTHKPSQITNDANDYANETVGDPRYPLDLLLRVVSVSLQTLELVRGLPKLGL